MLLQGTHTKFQFLRNLAVAFAFAQLGCAVEETQQTQGQEAATAEPASDANSENPDLGQTKAAGSSSDAAAKSSKKPETVETATCPEDQVPFSEPGSILALAAWIKTLPKPLAIECLLELLPKPAKISATTSTVSVQPAIGLERPRIFIFIDDLILAVVPDNTSETLLELSELRATNSRSLKAEFAFPLQDNAQLDAPFARVFRSEGGGSVCAACHGGEVPAPDVAADAYESLAFKPFAQEILDRFVIEAVVDSCLESDSTQRCRILRAVTGPSGDFVPQAWPTDMPTIF